MRGRFHSRPSSLSLFASLAFATALAFSSLHAATADTPAAANLPTLEQTSRDFYGSERARKTLMSFPSRGER
ncbi:MAG: hypothetical protein L0Z50_26440, partial [Verrucomicrobiales bacterium]|nr:hypothetical protein [Verrucomicrobiales bacterium]